MDAVRGGVSSLQAVFLIFCGVTLGEANPTFSACCGCWETFKPLDLRVRDSPITWLRQYQYNLHSPLQPGVVKALLLVLRSSAALALAAVAPLCVAQFIRMRTARSPTEGLATGLYTNRLQTANLTPSASIQNVCGLQNPD